MLGLVFVKAASRASRSAGVYFDRKEDTRDGNCDAVSYMDDRENVRGDGAFLFAFMLPGREYATLSGATSAPGSGGNGLFMSTVANEVVLLNALSLLGFNASGVPSNTPAAAGEMIEKAILLHRSWDCPCTAVSSIKLDLEERPL